MNIEPTPFNILALSFFGILNMLMIVSLRANKYERDDKKQLNWILKTYYRRRHER